MIPRKWFNDPDKRWLAFWLLLASALVEVGHQVYNIRKGPEPGPAPGDPAIYRSLEDQPGTHARIAQWANQFMEIDDALEIIRRGGFECRDVGSAAALREIHCRKVNAIWEQSILIKADHRFLRSVSGSYAGFGERYFEVRAPGFEFSDAQSLTAYFAERLRLKEAGSNREDRPVKVGGYRSVTEYLAKRLGMTCSDEMEATCETQSLRGQRQQVIVHLSEDALPDQLEGILDGGTHATITLASTPDETESGEYEVLVREAGKPPRIMKLASRSTYHQFDDKVAATYAALDEPSKVRVMRAVARQLDAVYKWDDDDALRPLLQQLDFGALYVRRLGPIEGGPAVARGSTIKTYAAFALADCDSRAPPEARACFAEYAAAQPELQPMLERAIAEVKTANPGLDAQHPVTERLQRLAALTGF